MPIQKQKSGFTLIELVMVMAVIAVVVGISFDSLNRSQSQQVFNNTFDKVVAMIANARSLAITGKGQLDYTDFDKDGCNNTGAAQNGATCSGPDYVTPANYGVYLKTPNPSALSGDKHNRVTLFADNHLPASGAIGSVGVYDAGANYANGQDLELASFTLPTNLKLSVDDPGTGSILFSPNYADISFDSLTADPFLTIQLETTKPPKRCRQIKIHKLAGVPEIAFCN